VSSAVFRKGRGMWGSTCAEAAQGTALLRTNCAASRPCAREAGACGGKGGRGGSEMEQSPQVHQVATGHWPLLKVGRCSRSFSLPPPCFRAHPSRPRATGPVATRGAWTEKWRRPSGASLAPRCSACRFVHRRVCRTATRGTSGGARRWPISSVRMVAAAHIGCHVLDDDSTWGCHCSPV